MDIGRWSGRFLTLRGARVPHSFAMNPAPTSSLPNLGPRSQQWLASVGIHTAEQLRQQDPYDVYARLKRSGCGVSVNLLYALMGAVEGIPWQQVQRERRSEILMRLDDMGLLSRPG